MGQLHKLWVGLGLVILVLGAIVYFCPAINNEVKDTRANTKSNSNIWSQDASLNATQTATIAGYPYQFPGTLLMVCGFVLFACASVYEPVLKRLKPVKADQVKKE
jgi:hypothetical protein